MATQQPPLHTVEEMVKYFGGTKVVKKVLIANNGISAVKAIRSMRKWLYKILGNECEISFVVLATPDDMKINAEVPTPIPFDFFLQLFSLFISFFSSSFLNF